MSTPTFWTGQGKPYGPAHTSEWSTGGANETPRITSLDLPYTYVVLDESSMLDKAGHPTLELCSAVVMDQRGFYAINSEIEKLKHEISLDWIMSQMESYEKFKNEGFHACDNPYEIRDKFFLNFLAKRIDLRILIEYISRDEIESMRLDARKSHLGLYHDLLGLIFRRKGNYQVIFEQNSRIDPYLNELVDMVARRKGAGLVDTWIAKKEEPFCLAIPDYALWGYCQWVNDKFTIDPQKKSYRYWRAIQRLASVVKSRDSSKVYARSLPL